MRHKFNPTVFYAVYDSSDKCIGVFDTVNDLVNSWLIGISKRGFEQMCSRWGRKHGKKETKITEENKVYCSQKIYQYTNLGGYSIYKFWEEDID